MTSEEPHTELKIKKATIGRMEIFSLEEGGREALNGRVLRELLDNRSRWAFSHKINGRWENTYLSLGDVPSARTILNHAARAGRKVYGKTLVVPRSGAGLNGEGFWFNIALPGQATGRHRHSPRACASGVYYLKVPAHSGNIVFRGSGGSDLEYPSREGLMLLFPPTLDHAVLPNRSGEERISLAFNLFTLPLEIPAGDSFTSQSLHA